VDSEQEIEKKYAEAFNAFDNEEYEEAVKILLPLLKSGHPELFHLLGACYFNLREPLKALLALKEFQEELSQDTNFLYLLGMTYQQLFLSELAINAFQLHLKMGNRHEGVYLSLLRAFFEADRMDELIEMAREAVRNRGCQALTIDI
jgi:tetratricopeptide (TPR) repeat protein